ncbi:MAG: hypothetical protein CMN93_02810, partial [Synechococcus sp. CPC35]|nr:hypothetical protein [Synechococcus sp. CPC35]
VDTSGGTPQLSLETGSTDQTVSYASGSGTNTLAFSYTVQDGDISSDLNYKATSSLALNGATIRDSVGTNATLTLPALASSDSLAGNNALVIDTTAPVITGPSGGAGASTSSLSFTEGGTAVTQMSANETVTWSLGTTGDEALFNIDSNGNLSFQSAADYETPLDSDGNNSYVLNIKATDTGNNQSTQQLTVDVTDTDDTGPSITSVSSTNTNGEYGINETIAITVEFTEVVTVVEDGGTPYLTLETGTNDQEILYTSGSGTNTLSFTYTVASGDQSVDLDARSTTALSSNGGTIRDAAGNDAVLTLATPGTSNSLSANKAIVIDGVAPVLSSPSPIDVNENASNNFELHDFNDLSGDDTDELGDSLTYSIQSGNSDGIFGIGTNDGKLIVQDNSLLDHGNNDKYTLTIEASDGCNIASTSATINVIDVNNNPVAFNDSVNLNENATAEQTSAASGILSNDTDSDGDSITIENFRTGSESGSGDYGIIGSSREGTYGSLTLNGDGTYSYVADLAAADALATGVTATDSYTYLVSDGKGGDTGEISFTITGVNDAPHFVDAIAKKKYTEGQGATIIIDGSLTVTDVDNNTIESASITISSGYQPTEDILGFSNTSEISGSWDAASGQLSLSGTATKSAYATALASVTYSNSDDLNPVLGHRTVSWQLNDGSAASNTASSIIDVGGVNDSPESTNDAGSVDASSSINVSAGSGLLSNDTDPESNNLTVTDIRTGGESQSGTDGSVSSALTGTYGALTVSSDGSYTYNANQTAADALAEGATAVDVFTYTLSDGTDEDLGELAITVTGTNNAPTGSDDSKPVNENDSINITATSGVLINDTDVDGDDLTITAVQKVSSASSRRLFRDARKWKKKGRKLSFLARRSELSSSALPQLKGTYGELTLNRDGSFAYDANQSATDALNEGDSVTDSFTYTVSDNKTTSSATLEIVVTGVNDYPSITSPSPGTISEITGSSQTQTSGLTGTITATDVDSSASLEYGILGGSTIDSTTSLAGNYGTLELDTSTGDYAYTPDSSSIEALNSGDSVSDQFRISVSDSMALARTDFQVNITGASENSNDNGNNNIGNNNNGSGDSVSPKFLSAESSTDGLKIILKFNETLSSSIAAPLRFNIIHNGFSKTAKAVSVSGSKVVLNLEDPIQRNEIVTFSYSDPSKKDDRYAIQDRSGNDVSSMVDIPVTNKSRIEVPGNAPIPKTEPIPVPNHQTPDRPANTAKTPVRDPCDLKSINSTKQTGKHLRGSFCPDQLTGSRGDDYLLGRQKADELRSLGGNDTLKGGMGHDALVAGAGEDFVVGHQGHDLLRGGSGNDLLRGHRGRDTLKGGSGKDILAGGRRRDTLFGGAGEDHLHGQRGRDLLKGRSGNDLLGGNRGRDTLKGGPGVDILAGGRRRDTLIGGADADLFRISRGRDRIKDFDPAEGDRITTRSRFNLRIQQQGDHLLLLDRSQNIHTTLHNTSLEALLDAQPDLLS